MKKKIIIILFIITTVISAQSQPYVLLISFDGFRWDYHQRDITPNIEKMKSEGVSALSFQPAFPSKTFPNHYSIITGEYIERHGIIANKFIDPFTNEMFRLNDTSAVRNSRWYIGEPFWTTAERQGVICASNFWPGSEQNLSYRHPTYFEKYDHYRPHRTSVNKVMEWLELPYQKRPHFITLYFHDTDDYGHKFGPNSEEIGIAIASLDSVVGFLYKRLSDIGMSDSVNVVIVSDHGMTEISADKVINIETMLLGYKFKMEGEKPFVMILPEENDADSILAILKRNENHYKVYTKETMPRYYHYSENPFIFPIIVVADLGWSLVNDRWLTNFKKYGTKGNHGYDNHQMDMHGIFIARGPAFKKNYKTGTILNIDVYPLLCKIFEIFPSPDIDGKLDRIEFILNKN